MSSTTPTRLKARRVLEVGLAVACGVALVGFIEGTRPQASILELSSVLPAHGDEEAVPGQSYLELRLRRFGPNHRTTSDLARLGEGIPHVLDPVPSPTDADRAEALRVRAERRAFTGAPPVVPHPIDEQGSAACLACHAEGILLEGRIAPVVSHASYASCTQCHVPTVDRPWPDAMASESTFLGAGSQGWGTRAWQGAPPTMPHPRAMREQCASCHGVTGLPGLRTTHPDRQSCEQCHAPATTDGRTATPWKDRDRL